MTLRQKQSKFALMAGHLLIHAHEMGYEVTLGDAYRDPRVHGEAGVKRGYGAKNSYHKKRLAIALNLFKDGVYLYGTAAHQPIGEWWEAQGGTWGGRWSDGNHYSIGEGD